MILFMFFILGWVDYFSPQLDHCLRLSPQLLQMSILSLFKVRLGQVRLVGPTWLPLSPQLGYHLAPDLDTAQPPTWLPLSPQLGYPLAPNLATPQPQTWLLLSPQLGYRLAPNLATAQPPTWLPLSHRLSSRLAPDLDLLDIFFSAIIFFESLFQYLIFRFLEDSFLETFMK